MKKLEEEQFNKEAVKRKGFEHFRDNVKDLVSRGLIGYKEGGKTIVPTESQIKAMYEKVSGLPAAEKEVK
jgi:hypothetical protein